MPILLFTFCIQDKNTEIIRKCFEFSDLFQSNGFGSEKTDFKSSLRKKPVMNVL